MLTRLRIRNFQNHSKLEVNLDSPITTITGPSDVGKSAILRAIRWVCRNQPAGDSFIKEGEEETKVQLKVGAHVISRVRGKGENLYSLNGSEYRAFSSDVPDTIANILNVGDRNFQGQHEPVFWFSQTAGEVSRQLNSVVDLGIIDSSLAAIGQTVRHYQSAVQIGKERLSQAIIKKKKLDWVVEADLEYRIVEKLFNQRTTIAVRVMALQKAVESCVEIEGMRYVASCVSVDARAVGLFGVSVKKVNDKALALSVALKVCADQRKILSPGVPDIVSIVSSFEAVTAKGNRKERLGKLVRDIKSQEMVLDCGIPDVSVLGSELELYTKLVERTERLRDQISEYRGAVAHRESILVESEEFHKVFEESSEGICPICGREMFGAPR